MGDLLISTQLLPKKLKQLEGRYGAQAVGKDNASFAPDEGVDFIYERLGFLTPAFGAGERCLLRQAWAFGKRLGVSTGTRKSRGRCALCFLLPTGTRKG